MRPGNGLSIPSVYRGVGVDVDEGVYIPSDDTFMLIDAMGSYGPTLKGSMLEIGTGSGLLSISMLMANKGIVWPGVATDIDPRAVECAQKNAKKNGVELDVLTGDIFDPVRDRHFDVVAFNPPYLPEPHIDGSEGPRATDLDGGPQGHEVMARFLEGLPKHLSRGGSGFLVASSASPTAIGLLERANRLGIVAEQVAVRLFPFEKLYVYRITIP